MGMFFVSTTNHQRRHISASLAMLGKLSVAGTACRDRHQLVDKENILGFARSIDP